MITQAPPCRCHRALRWADTNGCPTIRRIRSNVRAIATRLRTAQHPDDLRLAASQLHQLADEARRHRSGISLIADLGRMFS